MDESNRAREIAFAASTITDCQGDHKAVISRLHRLKVDSDNLRFLHEEVYPLLGWDGGETPPLTFLEELIDEMKQLRATAELVERAGEVRGVFIQQRYCSDGWEVIRFDSTANFATLREALESLGETK